MSPPEEADAIKACIDHLKAVESLFVPPTYFAPRAEAGMAKAALACARRMRRAMEQAAKRTRSQMELKIDPARKDGARTRILIRAQGPDGKWQNADIYDLDADSLRTWLRSRGGKNLWAESVVGILLGHDVQAWQEPDPEPARAKYPADTPEHEVRGWSPDVE